MQRLNITSTVLDRLGFSEYWDEHCTWGGRTLTFSDGTKFRIVEQCEMDDEDQGYGYGRPKYIANHFYFSGWFAIPAIDTNHCDLFFLHEMYECIKSNYPSVIGEFVSKCKAVNMGEYIEEYLLARANATDSVNTAKQSTI